jgi:hypothetical protein
MEIMMKYKIVRMNIIIEIRASEYFAKELQEELDDKVLRNCFKTNDRELIKAKIEKADDLKKERI